MTNKKLTISIIIAALVIGVIAGSYSFFSQKSDVRSSAISSDTPLPAISTASLKVGASCADGFTATTGNGCVAVTKIIPTTCTILADASIAATSTGMADCQSSSIAVGDFVVFGGYGTSSVALTRQFDIQSTGAASTTAGFLPLRITNLTGASVVPSSLVGFGSSTPIIIYKY